MHWRLKTGGATLLQFIVGTILAFIAGIISAISGCRNGGVDCAANTFVSLILIILTVGAYGLLLGMGYVAQDRRSSRLALLLIACEATGAVIFLFDARHAVDIFDRATNLLSFAIAAWVIFIAFRQFRAGGSRLVKRAIGRKQRKA